jgi:hypothetical protein
MNILLLFSFIVHNFLELITVKLVSDSIHRFNEGYFFLAFQIVAILNKVSDKSEII